MPIYAENDFKWHHAALLLIVCYLTIFFPFDLGERELYWRECDYAAMASEIDRFPPLTVAHGELIPRSFPMFPWLASLTSKAGLDMAFSLRLLSVGALGLIALIVWEAGRRAAGPRAAAVAAAVMISSIVVVEKAVDGYPHFLALFFITLSWLSWFSFGAERGDWNVAWFCSMFLCGLGFYTIGWPAVIYFFFPLIFMRRPLTVWSKLRKPGFFFGVLALIVFILVWGVPRWSVGKDIPFRSLPFNKAVFTGYFYRLSTFPFKVAWRFLPWTLFAWAPFCVAFHPLDDNPIFSRFLRTIFISLFFLLWLSPFTESRDLIILAPPLAIMTGINYWLLARRYGFQLQAILRLCSVLCAIAATGLLVFFLLPVDWWGVVYSNPNLTAMVKAEWPEGAVKALAALGVALFLIGNVPPKLRVFEHALLVCVAVVLMFWAIVNPFKTRTKFLPDSKTNLALSMREAIGDDFNEEMTVYKDRAIFGLYGVCHYLGCHVKKIHSAEELPRHQSTIYLITTDVPTYTDRYWKKLGAYDFEDRTLYVWKGERVESRK